MSRIVTSRFELVPLTVDDADDMVEVLSDPALYTFIGGAPPTLTWLRERYARLVAGRSPDGRQQWHNWIVRRTPDARAVGTVQATVTDEGRQAEIAWIVGAAFQGQGYATAAAVALVEWLDARGVQTVTAHVHPEHQASMAVARSAGLRATDRYEDGERVWIRST
ncbi:GNAT family N-acetyltransferase [Jiangella alba]|uniref:Protein N-acetyltransferase, RimJ/RimL family n=1 Tax=Jiangella alba TaxID=561176 RepID=A0A1H5PMW8_9ACTN|nr:GNAT family N-acetyltransferase [Jiangella alba]SEF15116.1 Protein N-acetyltransferase, RimJ/RimL family [Jiangella alba]